MEAQLPPANMAGCGIAVQAVQQQGPLCAPLKPVMHHNSGDIVWDRMLCALGSYLQVCKLPVASIARRLEEASCCRATARFFKDASDGSNRLRTGSSSSTI